MIALRPYRHLLIAWVALVLLLAGTLGGAYLPLGSGNLALALSIAVAKAALVFVIFMEPAKEHPLGWVFGGAGAFWLFILLGLSGLDYLSRAMAWVR